MPVTGVFTEQCNSDKPKQPRPHCASVLSLAVRSWAFSGPSSSCYSRWKLGRQIFDLKKFQLNFGQKISLHSVDSLFLDETAFNGEQFNLDCFVTPARNIFVNNCGVLAFLQSLPHICLAASRVPRFYVAVLIFSWHNTLIAGSLRACSASHCCEIKNIVLSWFKEINHTGLHQL